jgi:hypothetical protein
MAELRATSPVTPMLHVDILLHCVFPLISLPGVVLGSMVCGGWRGAAARYFSQKNYKKLHVLLALFAEGFPIEMLRWFERHLSYPVLKNEDPFKRIHLECINLASKGFALHISPQQCHLIN